MDRPDRITGLDRHFFDGKVAFPGMMAVNDSWDISYRGQNIKVRELMKLNVGQLVVTKEEDGSFLAHERVDYEKDILGATADLCEEIGSVAVRSMRYDEKFKRVEKFRQLRRKNRLEQELAAKSSKLPTMMKCDNKTMCEYRGKTYTFNEFLPQLNDKMSVTVRNDGSFLFVDTEQSLFEYHLANICGSMKKQEKKMDKKRSENEPAKEQEKPPLDPKEQAKLDKKNELNQKTREREKMVKQEEKPTNSETPGPSENNISEMVDMLKLDN